MLNQLEKLEAAKAVGLVYLSLLSLTGPYWTVFALALNIRTDMMKGQSGFEK